MHYIYCPRCDSGHTSPFTILINNNVKWDCWCIASKTAREELGPHILITIDRILYNENSCDLIEFQKFLEYYDDVIDHKLLGDWFDCFENANSAYLNSSYPSTKRTWYQSVLKIYQFVRRGCNIKG